MFRQKTYNNDEDNNLMTRLNRINSHDMFYINLKFWDINCNAWVDCDNLNDYKIQKEVVIDNELIFYIYLENYI